MEEILETKLDLTGIEVGQGIDNYQETLEEMTEVAVGQDQV